MCPTVHPEVDVRPLAPHEAPLLVDCVRRCHGDAYLDPAFYDAAVVEERLRTGGLVSVGALAPDRMLAHMALFVAHPGVDLVGEAGMTMVDPEWRGQGLAWRVATGLGVAAVERGLRGLVDYPVTLHGATQRLGDAAAVYCGLLDANVPADTSFGGGSSGLATPSLVRYLSLGTVPERTVFVPRRYERLAARFYDETKLPRRVGRLPAAPEAGAPPFTWRYEPRRRRLSFRPQVTGSPIRHGGNDEGALAPTVPYGAIADTVAGLADEAPIDVVHVDVPLHDPSAEVVADELRAAGFFFGALVPERGGTDVLRLQSVFVKSDPPQTCPRAAEWIVAAVARDRDLVAGQTA